MISNIGVYGSAGGLLLLAVDSLLGAAGARSNLVLLVLNLVLVAAFVSTGVGVLRRRLWAIFTAWLIALIIFFLGIRVFVAPTSQLLYAVLLVYGIVLGALVLMSRTAFE